VAGDEQTNKLDSQALLKAVPSALPVQHIVNPGEYVKRRFCPLYTYPLQRILSGGGGVCPGDYIEEEELCQGIMSGPDFVV